MILDAVRDDDTQCILGNGAPLTRRRLRTFVLRELPPMLAALGVGGGARVGVVLPDACGALSGVAFFAFTARTVYCPLSPSLSAAEAAAELADLRPAALVVQRGAEGAAAAAARGLGIPVVALEPDGGVSGLFRLSRAEPRPAAVSGGAASARDARVVTAPAPAAATGSDICLLLHTSGTTSTPKTVPLTSAGLVWGARKVAETLRLSDADICVNAMPLYHIHALVANLLAPLISGSITVLPPGTMGGGRLLLLLSRHRATYYSATPTHHLGLLQAAQAERPAELPIGGLENLRFVRNCSAALAPSLALRLGETLGAQVLPTYAMTECFPMTSQPIAERGEEPRLERLGSVGPAAGPELKVASVGGGGGCEDTDAVAAGEVGEVCVRGEQHMMRGYLQVGGSFAGLTEAGWLRTGDLGYLDADGWLTLTGRCKEIINRGGECLSPFAIEVAVSAMPQVAACVAFSVPHEALGETVGVLAVPAADTSLASLAALRSFCQQAGGLSAKHLPSKLVWALPRALGLPAGRTGKPTRLGMAETLGLGLDAEALPRGDCFVGRRSGDGSWVLETFAADELSSSQTDAAAAALQSAAVVLARAADGTENAAQEVASVAEAVRRLAAAAMRIDDTAVGAATALSIDSVLLESGLDSIVATELVDDVLAQLAVHIDMAGEPELQWSAEILAVHPTSKDLAAALLAAARKPVHAAAAAAAAPPMTPVERHKATKAERARSFGGNRGVVSRHLENASQPGCGLHFAKIGDLGALAALARGGDWDVALVADRHGLSALQWAAGGGHLATVEWLLEGAPPRGGDVDKPNKQGRTALHWACRNGRLQVAKRLVLAGADPRASSGKGVSALHWAVWGQQAATAEWLLSPPISLSLNARSDAGCNVCVWAAASGGVEISKFLHAQGADFTMLNHWGHGVVNKAAWRGHLGVLKWMVKEVPGVVDQLFMQDYAGLTNVELAVMARGEGDHTGVVAYLRWVMRARPQPIRRAIELEPAVHQHKLRELGLEDPSQM